MNRRAFLVSLPFLPAAAKAVLNFSPTPEPIPGAYRANAWSIQKALADCGKVVDATGPLDFDHILEQIYAVKGSRDNYSGPLYFRSTRIA